MLNTLTYFLDTLSSDISAMLPLLQHQQRCGHRSYSRHVILGTTDYLVYAGYVKLKEYMTHRRVG